MHYFLPLVLLLASSCAHAGGPSLVDDIGTKRLELVTLLVQAFDAHQVCETGAYPAEVVKEVMAAKLVARPPAFTAFVNAVPEDSKLRQNIAYRQAIGEADLLSRTGLEDFRKALLNTIYYHYGHGVYGSQYNVTLQDNGVAAVNTLVVTGKTTHWVASTVKWRLVPHGEDSFQLQIGKDKFRPQQGDLGEFLFVPADTKEDGELDPDRTLTTNDSFCEGVIEFSREAQ